VVAWGLAALPPHPSFRAAARLLLPARGFPPPARAPPPNPAAAGLRYRVQKLREAGLQTFCASAAATLAGSPLVAASFHRVSLAGLVSNILCLPLCGLLTALAAGGAAAFVALPVLALPFLFAGTWTSQLLLSPTKLFASAPGAAFGVPSLGTWASVLFASGLVAFSVGVGRWRWAAIFAPAAILVGVVQRLLVPEAGFTCTFLAVGQGEAVVVVAQRPDRVVP